MLELLGSKQPVLLVYLGLLIYASLAQSLAWQLVHTRYGRRLIRGGSRRIFEAAVVVFLLAQLGFLGLQLNYLSWSILGPVPATLRWIGWAAVIAAAIAAQIRRRSVGVVVATLVCTFSLPFLDLVPPPWPGLVGFAVVGFLGVRGTVLGIWHFSALRAGISALSVQEAIDRLPSGLMFVRQDASVVLINTKMRAIMAAVTGAVHRHGADFLTAVEAGATAESVDPENPVFELADGTYWLLTRAEVEVQSERLVEIVATDVSLRWGLVKELRETQELLEASAWQLQAQIDGLADACLADELMWTRIKVHDVIGQRVSALLRLVKDGSQPEREVLVAITAGLGAELDAREPDRTPAEELRLLRTSLDQIGVKLQGPDELPDDQSRAALVVDIVREAVSNAVKHGSATLISADYRQGEEICRLSICNNGYPALHSVVEGGGLKGMRYRLAEVGGQLTVVTAPEFNLIAEIPRSAP